MKRNVTFCVPFREIKFAVAAEINAGEIEVPFKYIRVFTGLLLLRAYIINIFCLLGAGFK